MILKLITENKLNSEIELINQIILEKISDSIISIILYGGYGRGEGAFYYDEQKKIRTYNDFDIVLVVKSIVEENIINQILKDLNKKIDVKWIDLSQKSLKSLKNLKLSIFNYDLKNGSRVIYGDQKIFNEIPSFKAKNIKLKEAETLYFTRLWAFLGSLPLDGFDRKLNSEEVRFFNYQMTKAILAVVDVILLNEAEYCTSYKERVKKLVALKKDNKDLVKWSNWAIGQKLFPSCELISPSQVKQMYKDILSLYIEEMYSILSVYYNRKIKNSFDIKQSLLYSKSEWIIFVKLLLKTRSLSYAKDFKMKLIQSFLVEAFLKKENQKEILLKESRKLFKQISKLSKCQDWNSMRIVIAKLREG